MIGTLLNAGAIVLGGLIGAATDKQLSALTQARLKVLLGALTVYVGLSMALSGFSGGFGHRIGQLLTAILALSLGHLTGQILRLQKGFSKLARFAQTNIAAAPSQSSHGPSNGFVTCTILFCVGPLAILGALQDGLLGSAGALVIKAVLDGLATVAFAKVFGWGVVLAAIPVLAWQGSITLLASGAAPYLQRSGLLDSVSLTEGLLVFSVALVILDLRKIALVNYLPSLVYAPALTYLWSRN